jgi:hypothetical protein
MDTDMYAGRHFIPELLEIITTDLNQSLIYAVHDLWAERCYRPRLPLTISRYINGGFYVIRNTAKGKALMKLARKLLIQNIRMVHIVDQDAINMALHQYPTSLYLLPGHFNCFHAWCWDRKLEGQAIHHRKGANNFRMLRMEYAEKCVHENKTQTALKL